jgi:hypothetical protein
VTASLHEEVSVSESIEETKLEDEAQPEGVGRLEEETKPQEKTKRKRRIPVRTVLLIGGAFILGFVILGVITIQVWEYSNSVEFCANACHDVHPEEIAAFRDSYHANVKCTECHMGRGGTIENVFRKASHFRHLPEVIFDAYDRPLESETMRPANESCELCHWPPAFHGDTVRQITRFQPDEENTQRDTYLILKTGAGEREEGLGYGIHWHITNPVEYIATDEHKEEVPWVRTTLPDGRTIEYNDVSNPLSPEEIEEAEVKVMDCVDCHNRMGHPFPSPGDLVDAAMVEGVLSPDLPYAKKTMMDLLTDEYESQEEALGAIGMVRAEYESDFPEVAAQYPQEIDQAEQLAEELVRRLVFEEPGVTWEDFPDHNRHQDFPGCFRCHNGKHLSDDGESIRLHCNICHNVPETVAGGGRPPQVPLSYVEEPASHLESNFMADHRFLANGDCESCHGEIEFGADDSSFCANSSCHGRAWPYVELDAAFVHPIELEGKHAEVWCHDCHEGVEKPEYECVNCHEPPPAHFGPECEDCHTPAGFEEADMGDFEHPLPLEGAHASAGCSDCHVEGAEISSDCASCHEPPPSHFGPDCAECHTPTSFAEASLPAEMHPIELVGAHATASCEGCHVEGEETPEYECANCHEPPASHFGPNCEECHTPTSFSEASLSAEMHPIELVGAHATASCEGCHVEGEETPGYECSNCHEAPENHLPGECDTCHTPEGFAESAAFLVSVAPEIEHEVEGRDDCLMCHDPSGQIRPAPSNHVDYENEQCVLCHKPES